MKKFIVLFLVFCFIFSSSCFALGTNSDNNLIVEGDLSIHYQPTRSNQAFERSYDFWNRVFSAGRGYFCAIGDYYRNLLDWWKHKKNKSTDDEIYQYFEENTTVNNNYYNFSQELSYDLNDYAAYLNDNINTTISVPCFDMYGKNFKFNGSNVDTSSLSRVFDLYDDDYDIFLCVGPSSYNNDYYFNTAYSDFFKCFRLVPKQNIYYYVTQLGLDGYTLRYFNQLEFANFETFTGYELDSNLNLVSVSKNISSGTICKSLFSVKVGSGISYGDPFIGCPTMCIPISYKYSKVLNTAYDTNITSSSSIIYNIPNAVTNSVNADYVNSLPNVTDIENYTNYRDLISGQNTTNSQIYNYITNIYPNGNDYTNDPIVNDSPGGLLTSLGDGLGKLGTAIGAIIGAIINALINILAGIVSAFTSVLSLFTTLLPDTFKGFMQIFYGLIPEPIMNGVIALFSLTCIMAVIRIIRK